MSHKAQLSEPAWSGITNLSSLHYATQLMADCGEQVADTEVEIVAPEFRLGPVQGNPADEVATKSESFLLPNKALVSHSSCHRK